MRHAYSLALAAALAACNAQAPDPSSPTDPTNPTTTSTGTSHGLKSFAGAVPLLSPGPFTMTSPPSPGTATFSQATYDADPSQPPSSFGGGSLSLTLDGTAYDDSTVQSFYMNAADDSGTSYLLVGAMREDPTTNLVDVLYVVTKTSDFAAGADVALDGYDRVAVFAHGDPAQPAPSVYAIATSGTVHFSAGDTNGAAIDASLTAQFALADYDSSIPDGGTRPDAGTMPLPLPAAGPAALTIDTSTPEVSCFDGMSGQEATYASITGASLGLASGAVTIGGVQADQLTLSGAVLTQMFAQADVTFTADTSGAPVIEADLPDVVLSGAPSGTTQQGVFIYFDATSSTHLGGEVLVLFTDAQEDGYCELAYPINVDAS